MHPKAQQAAIFAQERKSMRDRVKDATKNRGLHFVVCSDHTFCYSVTGRIIKFSTSVRSNLDKPDLIQGKFTALVRFDSDAVVRFRLRKHQQPKKFFSWIIDGWINLVETKLFPVRFRSDKGTKA